MSNKYIHNMFLCRCNVRVGKIIDNSKNEIKKNTVVFEVKIISNFCGFFLIVFAIYKKSYL